MTGWLIFITYTACWLATSVFATRWVADNFASCKGKGVDGQRHLMDGHRSTASRSTCIDWHGEGCYRPDGEITISRFVAATILAAAWPLIVPLGVTWSLANKRPTVGGLQKEIARLEREVGIQ